MIYIGLIVLLVLIQAIFGETVVMVIVCSLIILGIWYSLFTKSGRALQRQIRAEEKEKALAKRVKKEHAYALRLEEAREKREYWDKFRAEKPELYEYLLRKAQEKEWAQQQADNDEWFWFWSNW